VLYIISTLAHGEDHATTVAAIAIAIAIVDHLRIPTALQHRTELYNEEYPREATQAPQRGGLRRYVYTMYICLLCLFTMIQ